MDDGRFDALTKLAAGASRRRVAAGFAAALAGALGLGRGTRADHIPGHSPGGGQPVCGPARPCPQSNNLCAVNECVGTGASARCVERPGNAGAVCRPAAGPCDVAEVCTGVSTECPRNAFVPMGTICRAPSGECELPARCTGDNANCPRNPFVPAGTVCRPAAGPCDVAESCTGSDADCPQNRFRPAGTVCRQGVGGCDPSETCTGDSAQCPADVVDPCPGSTVCCTNPRSRQAGRCVARQACTRA